MANRKTSTKRRERIRQAKLTGLAVVVVLVMLGVTALINTASGLTPAVSRHHASLAGVAAETG